MTYAYDSERVGHVIDCGADAIEDAVGEMVMDLIDRGAIRIHADSEALERNAIIKRAKDAAVRSVLTSQWAALDDETTWLYLTRETA